MKNFGHRKLFLTGKRKDSGIVLILLAIFLPVLLILLALAIDLSISKNATEQARSFVRMTALLAMEQYEDSEGAGATFQDRSMDRLDQTIDRVNEVIKKNRLLGGDNTDLIELKYRWESGPEIDQRLLLPGTVHYVKPESSAISATCYSADEFPCFDELDPSSFYAAPGNSDQPLPINGFKVESKVSTNGIRTRFARAALGISSLPIFASATSTTVAKNVMILVDLSVSSVSDTHVLRNVLDQAGSPQNGVGGYYAFPADKIGASSPALDCDNPALTANQQSYWCHWDFLDNDHAHSRPGGNTNQKEHFYSEYPQDSVGQVDIVPYVQYLDPGKTNHPEPSTTYIEKTGTYYVDNFTNPEPLTSIFTGVAAITEVFKERANSGDQIGMILFEKNLWWSRFVKLSRDFDYITKLSGFSTGNFVYTEQMKDLGFFPTEESFTNIPGALTSAYGEIISNPLHQKKIPQQNMIIYVGDAFSNCINNGAPVSPTAIPSPSPSASPSPSPSPGPTATPNTSGIYCNDVYAQVAGNPASFKDSVTEIETIINNALLPNSITFNVIHIGSKAGAHVLDVQQPNSTSCLSENEAMLNGQHLILGGDVNNGANYPTSSEWNVAYANATEAQPFFEAAKDAYRLARATGGRYVPVLKSSPCTPDPTGCKNIPYPYRRTTDRQCRNTNDQITDALKEIIDSGSPYRIVDED